MLEEAVGVLVWYSLLVAMKERILKRSVPSLNAKISWS
jgi:hypothetical protein